ncbi:MAG: DnaJ domain-containing protein [Telluria sp.]
MPSLTHIEQCIFDIDGIRASLSGPATGLQDYWTNRFNGDKTVSEFKKRFSVRYPDVDVVLYDGLGRVAHGRYLMKNLRVTHDFGWVQDTVAVYEEYIESLKIALQQAAQTSGLASAEPDPYEVLGVDRNSSIEEIRQAYRIQIRRFHPDKLGGLELDQAFIHFGTERTQLINRARDQIFEERAEAEAA